MTQMLFDKAKVAFVKGNFQEAIEAFGELIEKDPENAMAYYSRGTARFNVKDYDGAIEDYTKSLSLDESNARVLCSRGAAYLAQEKGQKAMDDFNASIDLNEFYATPYFGRAEVFTRMGEEDQARMDLETGNKIQQKRGQSLLEGQGIMFQDPNA